jgi:hypothetical protein
VGAHGTGASKQQDEALRAQQMKIHQMKMKMAEQRIVRSAESVDYMGGISYVKYGDRPTSMNDI